MNAVLRQYAEEREENALRLERLEQENWKVKKILHWLFHGGLLALLIMSKVIEGVR